MHPYVVTIASEKGGVGKTTLATNLAIYLKALAEHVPVTVVSFDNHFSVDKMFSFDPEAQPEATVVDLFQGRPWEELVQLGEYGVGYIPSNRQLADLRSQLTGAEHLAQRLCRQSGEGILLIDTRPDLDIFTQNALYVADRVVIPVKDAPSLENCRHIYEFFDNQGLSRNPLRVLPCLVDGRIHYQEGPFKEPQQLLKGYAIHRGWKCLEGYISKSPKVESLNTNPEGKVYPVLSHGRGTEVHQQFSRVARRIYLDSCEEGPQRLAHIQQLQQQRQEEQAALVAQACERLQRECLLCGSTLIDAQGQIQGQAFFGESLDGELAGFCEVDCLLQTLLQGFYPAGADSLGPLLLEAAEQSYLLLSLPPRGQQQAQLVWLDSAGQERSRRSGRFQRHLEPVRLRDKHPRQLLLSGVCLQQPLRHLQPGPYRHYQQILERCQQYRPASPQQDGS